MAGSAESAFSSRLERLLRHPIKILIGLVAVATAIELAQYTPEVFWGAHAIGEVVRNFAYAMIGAVAFHWVVVEAPSQRRRRKTYDFHRQAFELLLAPGPGLIKPYQQLSEHIRSPALDVWNEASVKSFAVAARAALPSLFAQPRTGLMKTIVEIGIPRALVEIAPSISYMDTEVAHALSMFPRQEGMTVLQVELDAAGFIDPNRDAHITWSLLEASRRLYVAVLDTGAFEEDIFSAVVGEPPNEVKLTPDVLRK